MDGPLLLSGGRPATRLEFHDDAARAVDAGADGHEVPGVDEEALGCAFGWAHSRLAEALGEFDESAGFAAFRPGKSERARGRDPVSHRRNAAGDFLVPGIVETPFSWKVASNFSHHAFDRVLAVA